VLKCMSLSSYPCALMNMVILVCILYKVLSAVSNFIGRAPHHGVSQHVHVTIAEGYCLLRCDAMRSGKNLSKFRWLISHLFPHLNSESRVSPNVAPFLPEETMSYKKRQFVQIPHLINSKPIIW